MSLHRLTHVVMGVPDVDATSEFYRDFGLVPGERGRFSTSHGGEQLRIVQDPHRRIVELGIGADDPDDLDRIERRLQGLGFQTRRDGGDLVSVDPGTQILARVRVVERLLQPRLEPSTYNGPGRHDRTGRAPGILRCDPVTPRRLGHVVSGTPDLGTSMRFLVDGLGFKISDHIAGEGAFLRCSEDHHNLLVMRSPITYLHHTSWQVDDIDEVGRGAFAMLEKDPSRHVWGLGRHHAGSNFFWYLKDPAGNFAEYFSDMDVIPEDEVWTPEILEGARGLFNWGPPPPPSFLAPEDLAGLMTGAHSS